MRGNPLRMPVAVVVLVVLFVIPGLIGLAIWLQLKSKEKRLARYLAEAREELAAAGAEPLGDGLYRWNDRAGKIDASTNPLFGRGFSIRVAAWSDTIHEFELKRGRPVPAEFRRFAPLLERWDSAGKMVTECYAAGVPFYRQGETPFFLFTLAGDLLYSGLFFGLYAVALAAAERRKAEQPA